MAAVNLTEFLPDVMAEVMDCTEPQAVNALRQAAHRLCSFAPVWVVEGTFVVVGATPEYDVVAQAGVPVYADVVRVMSPVWINGGERRVYATPRVMLDRDSGWPARTGPVVETFFQPTVRSIRVVPTPDSTNADALTLRVWVRPMDGATQVEDVLLQEYRTTIAEGAKARLTAMRGQPWSDPVAAVYYGRTFNQGLTAAYARTYKSYTDGDLSVQMRPLA